MLVAAYEIYDKCYTLRRFHQNDIFKFKRFKVINTFYNFILFFISVIINRIKFKFVNQEKKQVLLQIKWRSFVQESVYHSEIYDNGMDERIRTLI